MTIAIPVLYNAALSGFVAGQLSKRLNLLEPGGGQVEPSDFAAIVTAGKLFAAEVDAVLQTVESPPGNIAALGGDGVTIVPATSAESNAAGSLPQALSEGTKSAWNGRSLPTDATTGLPFTQAQYQPVANYVVALFVEYATSTNNT